MITGNINVARKVANGTRCVMLSLSYDSATAAIAQSALQSRAPGELVIVPRPQYIIVSVGGLEVVVGSALGSKERTDLGRKVTPMRVEPAYACTFHKVQGETLPSIVLDLNLRPAKLGRVCFESLYVALTRVTSIDALYLLPERGRGFAALCDKAPGDALIGWLAARNGSLAPPPPTESRKRRR